MFFLLLAAGSLQAVIPEAVTDGDCLNCHEGIEHIGKGHDFDCRACHLKRQRQRVDSIQDHQFIIRNPSDPEHVDFFCGTCHQEEIKLINASLHATAAGIVNQTRYLWGAQRAAYPPEYSANSTLKPLPEAVPHPNNPKTLVDDFLRRKCLRCHIGTKGAEGIGLYRASGCASCHVLYSDDGRYQGHDRAIDSETVGYPIRHRFVRRIPLFQCLHCHNHNHVGGDYVGMFEHDYDKSYRSPVIEGRTAPRPYGLDYHYLAMDVHAERGMECTDCHTKSDVMGTGTVYGYEAEVPKTQCIDCHGGFCQPTPNKAVANIKSEGEAFLFRSNTSGRKFKLALFSKDVVSHNIPQHKEVRCGACHAQWSYQDYGLSVMRDDSPDYGKWARLLIQGDFYLEGFLRKELNRVANQPPVSPDWLDGNMKPGIWYSGWRARRWEFMPLGLDSKGKYAVLRPRYQYFVSYIDKNGDVVLDSVAPKRGDGKGVGWAFMPYRPHTISPVGRKCEGCHLNETAAGRGIFRANTCDSELFLPSPPAIDHMRLLNKKERDRLLRVTEEYRVKRFLYELTTTR